MNKRREQGFPGRDAIVAFVRAHPGKVGTREIAREFGLKNADRVELKRILRELADEGAIAKQGRKLHQPAELPPTVVADITGRDSDGELIATPDRMGRGRDGAAPNIRIAFPRRPQPGTAAGVGDRALVRVERIDEGESVAYRGRVIRVLDQRSARMLGMFRKFPDGGGRLIPVDKKQVGRELNIAKADSGGRRRRRPRQRRSGPHPRLWACLRQGEGAARFARDRKGDQPDRDPRPRNPAGIFTFRRCAKRRRQSPPSSRAAKTGATFRWSPSIRPTPRITTTPARRADTDERSSSPSR